MDVTIRIGLLKIKRQDTKTRVNNVIRMVFICMRVIRLVVMHMRELTYK